MDTIIEHDGIEWLCFYEYDAPQKETEIDPPIRGIATIYSLYLSKAGGLELYDHINPRTIHALEAIIEASHEDY